MIQGQSENKASYFLNSYILMGITTTTVSRWTVCCTFYQPQLFLSRDGSAV